jgi:transposase
MLNYSEYINKIKKMVANTPVVGLSLFAFKQNIETLLKLLEESIDENKKLREENAKLNIKIKDNELKNKKDSHNSHMPPSTDKNKAPSSNTRKYQKKEKSKKSTGGQAGHKGTTLNRNESPDKIEKYYLKGKCKSCNLNLSKIMKKTYFKKQEVDIRFTVYTTDHVVECGKCNCGVTHIANHPTHLNAPVQYGASVKGFVSYLTNYQLLPFERTQDLFRDIFNLPMSEGTIFNVAGHCHEKLLSFEKLAGKALINSKVNHSDETPINVNKKKNYLHVLSNEYITLIKAHTSRGFEAIDSIGLLKKFKGFLVSDFFSMYYSLPAKNVACHSHLQRELTYLIEEFKIKWAKKIKKFFLKANKEIKKYRKKRIPIPHNEQVRYKKEFDLLITVAIIETPNFTKIGKKTDAENLLARFIRHTDAVLRFTTDSEIPFTNNIAERDFRMAKTKQKVSGGFRTFEGLEKYARLRSYISTVKKQGRNVLQSLNTIFSSQNPNFIELFT